MEDVTNMEVIRKFVDLAPQHPRASPWGCGVRRPTAAPAPRRPSGGPRVAPPEGEGKNFLVFSSWMWEPSGGGLRLSLCWPAEGISSGRIKK